MPPTPVIWGPKTDPRSLLFRCFFKNGDFVKIVLPLWWEHSFQGLDLPKIDLEIDCERQRRTTSTKIASDGVSERTFQAFFRQCRRFLGVRLRFLTISDSKTSSRRLLFRVFFEKGAFAKIVLPLWWEHSFQGSDPPKISPETDSERQRREKT